eukprot:1149731-Pelagomonas_calceolata.AAC.2
MDFCLHDKSVPSRQDMGCGVCNGKGAVNQPKLGWDVDSALFDSANKPGWQHVGLQASRGCLAGQALKLA